MSRVETGQGVYQKTPKKPKTRKPLRYRKASIPKDELEYMNRVKQLPCCICGRHGPSDAHHPISDRYSSKRASNYAVIPLCKLGHTDGELAIHRNKSAWEERNGKDWHYISETLEKVGAL